MIAFPLIWIFFKFLKYGTIQFYGFGFGQFNFGLDKETWLKLDAGLQKQTQDNKWKGNARRIKPD